jgi:hypothetical protein
MIDHEIFHRSELLLQNIAEVIDRPWYDSSARITVCGNLCQLSIAHSCAFRSLSERRLLASAFVILRAQFEAVLRAVWSLYCATDDQIERLVAPLDASTEQAAKNLPQAQEMLAAISKVPNAIVPFEALDEFKTSSWKALNSFTHAGIHPLRRIEDGYPVELLVQNVRVSNGLSMVAAMQLCILTGLPGHQRSLSPLHERFRDCLSGHRVSP